VIGCCIKYHITLNTLNNQTVQSSRPGRPPKRTSVPLVPMSQHGGPPQFLSMKKHRLENGDYHYDHHHNPAGKYYINLDSNLDSNTFFYRHAHLFLNHCSIHHFLFQFVQMFSFFTPVPKRVFFSHYDMLCNVMNSIWSRWGTNT
jgi:hypothetical protein